MRLRLLLIVLTLLSAFAWCSHTQAGPYDVKVETDPAVIPIGKATLRITVTSAGKPVDDAQVKAIAQMPGMPMGEKEETATPDGKGVYVAPAVFAMQGGYEARVSISGSRGSGVAVIPLQTGANTKSSSMNWPLIIGGIAAVAVVSLVVVRMRRTGQAIPVSKVLSSSVLGSLVLLGIAITITVYGVNHWRRAGSMTPMEAQGMEMNTPAPAGVTPVTLATVNSGPFSASVTYTGQAVGFTQQDVIARVTGALVWMPFYVGDTIKKGQLLAKLDTSQLQPELQQQQAALQSAQRGVDVAQSDYRQAQAGVSEAQAELEQYQGGLEESQANLSAVKEDRKAADSQLAAAKAQLANAQAGVSAAQADKDFADKQAERADKLLAAGAISQQDAQQRHTEAQRASAALNQANQQVIAAQASVDEAQSNIRKSDAQVSAAQKRVLQAQSMLMSHHAHVRTAQAATGSAETKIEQARAQVNQMSAAVAQAAAAKGYSEIYAQTDGVVTDRLISPGTLVNEGQAIIRIAQIRPIRLQANVAESDLANVRIGASVIVWPQGGSQPIYAKVSSVSPSVDPMSRTGSIEVLYANKDRQFLPGQFIKMQIAKGAERSSLSIPADALQIPPQVDGATPKPYVWLAVSSGGQLTAQRRDVKVGLRSADQIEIIQGLKPGDKVVVQGASDLVDGQQISNAGAQ